MSEYREKLQKMMLRADATGRVPPTTRPESAPYRRFYAVCEVCGYATLVAGYLLTIAAHL